MKSKSAPKSTPPAKPQKKDTKSISRPIYIVGMGGSAGGLEAFEQFFGAMPADAGVAFVIVPHLDPTTKGFMPELLQRATKMRVFQAEDAMKVRANCVYVIPPNRDISILHGTLHLFEPHAPRGLRLPIDFFMRSLADDQHERAIGIILSGMGSDGTIGLRAIKENLGMTMVQEPASAKYDAMPRSAIDAGVADFIAPVSQLPQKLLNYVRHSSVTKSPATIEERTASALQKAFVLLRDHTGHDFSFYKRNTLYRRIERRMSVHQIPTIQQYIRYMQENPAEIDFLFKEMLIGVTNFFRDAGAWAKFEQEALPRILKQMCKDGVLRAWAAGCSTGEEAFSLAITLREALDKTKPKVNCKIQVFATDIDKDAIEKARGGFFPHNIAADISPERLKRFFTREDSGYRVKKEIRELVIFAPQNLIMDPPFTKLDIICCRNLLIYLNAELQKKLIPLFHYALNPNGILFLGSSESIGNFGDYFEPIDNKWKIFVRKEGPAAVRTVIDLPSAILGHSHKSAGRVKSRLEAEADIPDALQKMLVNQYAPVAALINELGDILYIHGRTGKYLEPTSGKASMNIFFMAREGLRTDLNNAVRKAVRTRAPVSVNGLRVKTNGSYETINLSVRPCSEIESLHGLLLIVFEAAAPARGSRAGKSDLKPAAGNAAVRQMEKELKYTKESLQSTVEEMETSQEELKSANEELQSTNEELQSTNEELTTSKEEMQSLNEELVTVNTELESKVDALSRSNNDMKNLLDSIDLATIFLDNELNVKRFTVKATKLINLIQSDIGRPVTHIVSNLKYDNLSADVAEVMRTLILKELPVQTKTGEWYQMRIMPYRSIDNKIDGTAITFNDISPQKELEVSLEHTRAESRRAQAFSDALADMSGNPVLVLTNTMNIETANHAFCKEFGFALPEIQNRVLFDLGSGAWNIPALREICEHDLVRAEYVSGKTIELPGKKSVSRKFSVSARRILNEVGNTERILLAFAGLGVS
ncbi:MAG TPA: chemotaxis protein CheB [Planctomycetota bacterium]|nr:chemotaxis protein CheB [Planctomycetota bacterium]